MTDSIDARVPHGAMWQRYISLHPNAAIACLSDSISDATPIRLRMHYFYLLVSHRQSLFTITANSARDLIPVEAVGLAAGFLQLIHSKLKKVKTEMVEKYRSSSAADKLEVLLLSDVINTAKELEDLVWEIEDIKSVFEAIFGFHTSIEHVDAGEEQQSQIQVNTSIATFPQAHNDSNNFLIVYYGGHGRPGDLAKETENPKCLSKVYPRYQIQEYLLSDQRKIVMISLDRCDERPETECHSLKNHSDSRDSTDGSDATAVSPKCFTRGNAPASSADHGGKDFHHRTVERLATVNYARKTLWTHLSNEPQPPPSPLALLFALFACTTFLGILAHSRRSDYYQAHTIACCASGAAIVGAKHTVDVQEFIFGYLFWGCVIGWGGSAILHWGTRMIWAGRDREAVQVVDEKNGK
ncbi:MAG: hypothetical protein Q9166_003578 [cf. Caloplaca sp. 2 TL-2023]